MTGKADVMERKGEPPINLLHGKDTPALINAYFEFNHLKQLYRQGWLRRGISKARCESVAEHTCGVAVLAWLLAEAYRPELDLSLTLRLALIHDFGEIYAGDFTPADPVSPEDKHALELASVRQVFEKLPGGEAYVQLWEMYEAGATPEARFVKQLDRLEMALQAGVYEEQGRLDLHEFLDTAGQALSEPELIALLDALRAARGDYPMGG